MKNRLILPALAAALLSTAAIAQTSPPANQTQPPAPAPGPMAPAAPKPMEPATTGTTSPKDANAPLPGANSFTQAQAKSRIEQQGFSGIGELTKDDKGIWRGTATKDGKSVTVMLDFRGNVTSQ